MIAERGTPDLLEQTLAALADARAMLDEPCEVIVIVNGIDMDGYAQIQQAFPWATWHHTSDPLGYGGAISLGLKFAAYDWCYLLNSDMLLAPDALRRIIAYRRPEVFAVASQIFFVDQTRRREETGWTDFHSGLGRAEIYDRTPEHGHLLRAHLYAGGGSSLYQTNLLRGYVNQASDYSPFYWEDADWGARAWADGWQVLFCPESQAHHHHRSTIGKYYSSSEIERIIQRNAVLFDLRTSLTGQSPGAQMHDIAALPEASRRELTALVTATRAFDSRLAIGRARARGFSYTNLAASEWHAPASSGTRRPRILLASPFALYPPAHGGARRITEIVKNLSKRFDVILLSDERSSYTANAHEWFIDLYAIHLIEGRGDQEGEPPLSIASRMRRHAWVGLRAELRRLVALYAPDIVQIEYMELAHLIDERDVRDTRSRWILSMHDVELDDSLSSDGLLPLLREYDGVVTCTEDDRRLLASITSTVVANGAQDRRANAPPSPGNRLLFLGPFRYAPNRIGILSFIESCWPELKRRFPDLELTILSGGPYPEYSNDPRFLQDGIELHEQFEEPSAWFAQCSLTINPMIDIQGSSVKLIESLLARRICVSTRDGARGFLESHLGGLITTPDVKAMLEPISALLEDAELRHRHESSKLSRLDPFTWQNTTAQLESLYANLMDGRR